MTNGPRLDGSRLDAAFELVAGQVAGGRAGYAALAVGRSEGLVRSAAWKAGEGFVDPPRTSIASITKPITATAVLQLVEAGRLVLTEPVSTYLPEFRPGPPPDGATATEPVTTWHVLTHTAGLSDAPEAVYESDDVSPATLLDRVCREPLRFSPGSAYAYTSDSFYLLAALIERLSGLSYARYLQQRVFEPLAMAATTFDPSTPGPPGLPIAGDTSHRPPAESMARFVALEMPGGGLWSVPDDIVRFGRAMLLGGTLDGTRVLGRPFLELMVREHTADVREVGTGRRPTYGLGWALPGIGRGSPASRTSFGHAGASGSLLIVDPAYDLVIVYLRNEWGAPTTATEEAIQAVYGAVEG
jgi:CubicO group peptidase (beta-lactamase class C family)